MKYKNIHTGDVVSEEVYTKLLREEGEELWDKMSESEKEMFGPRESYIEETMLEADSDFEAIPETIEEDECATWSNYYDYN